ncbi:hypothetical protein E2C01_025274 [Portunus trituberculatus]|uniref:Uncharacterized protein n=1 Tax=Portunus trituberculatus TaxID=210409 RepID=A0A5B7EG18_PORTR|nr:hypothetical protein [Portunus trituberculatus]
MIGQSHPRYLLIISLVGMQFWKHSSRVRSSQIVTKLLKEN